MIQAWISITLTLLAGVLLTVKSSATLRITEFEIETKILRIVVENTDAEFNRIALQGSSELSLGSWTDLPSAILSPINATHYEFTVALSEVDREFFRVIGSIIGTALDPDGDGMPDALEELIGTNPAIFDTDGDGFSDGVEYSYGTDPLEADDKPVFVDLPTVRFVLATSTGQEGDSAAHEAEILFDRPYSGIVNYAINPLGNTTAGG